MWSFVLELEPIGKGRPKFSTRGGFPKAYTPKKTREWTRSAERLISNWWGSRAPIDRSVAVGVDIVAVFARPQRLKRRKDPSERIPKTSAPDKDNIEKICLDSMSSILTNDAQVTTGRSSKFWAARGEDPHVEITIWIVGD